MRALLNHTLNYRYSAPILLGPHRFCLKPRGHGFQKLVHFELSITPEPDILYPLLAASGDEILRARFLGSTDRFLVRASSEVITQMAPPLELALEVNPPRLPYPVGHLNGDLMGALEGWLPNGQHDPAAVDLAQEALTGCDQMAMPFLKQQNKRVAGKDPLGGAGIESNIYEEGISAQNRRVVVIGGGDTGSDCVGTSNRQGAVSVTQFELMPKPPAARTELMPWPTYPMTLKTSTSHEEGCERKWAIVTKEFIGDGNGNLKAIRIADLEWKFSEDGRPARFDEIPGSERILDCELVLLAMGFVKPQQEGLLQELDIEMDERGHVKASEKDFQTNISRIFSCGDMRRGQSLVVWAISEGRECARKVDEYLMGSSILESKDSSLIRL